MNPETPPPLEPSVATAPPPHPQHDKRLTPMESRIVLIACLIQFVNIVDFVMVMPLGPDFATALNIPASDIGIVGGIYALAAGVMGLIGSFFLDRYARKHALLLFLFGLSVATLGGAIAWDRESMLVARAAAGLFGGPLAALSIALIADSVPPQRRGAAMGRLMAVFSVASVIGIPVGLELARLVSWHAPFVAVSVLGLIALAIAARYLPYHRPFANPVLFRHQLRNTIHLLSMPNVVASYFLLVITIAMGFIIIPNMSAHYQYNLNFPRAHLGLLYLVGGFVSFFTTRTIGAWLDHSSATRIMVYSTLPIAAALVWGFIAYPAQGFTHDAPVILISTGFMVGMGARNVAWQTVFSKIPPPEYRGTYASLQSAIIHFAQAAAAYAASLSLVEQGGKLLHVERLGWIALLLACAIPFILYRIEHRMKKQN